VVNLKGKINLLVITGFVSLLALIIPILFHSQYYFWFCFYPITIFVVVLILTILNRFFKINRAIKLLIAILLIPVLASFFYSLMETIWYVVSSGTFRWYNDDIFDFLKMLQFQRFWLNIFLPIEILFCGAYGTYALFIYRRKQKENKIHLENEMEQMRREIDELKNSKKTTQVS
jgi:hypothetical protein